MALKAVRAVGSVPGESPGSVPRFYFVLEDEPTHLVVELVTAAGDPPSGRHLLAVKAEQWGTRVYRTRCDQELGCQPPSTWLSVDRTDRLLGWVDLRPDGASLCLAAIRGPGHGLNESLPCTTLLYTPAIPLD